MKVLVVEDDVLMLDFILRCLQEHGFDIESTDDGAEGYKKAAQGTYDAVVLDINLPSMLGTEICTKLRKNNITTPIMFLSSNHNADDRINGLEIGADDYLVKPFNHKELVARVKALVRRPTGYVTPAITYGNLTVDTGTRQVFVSDIMVKLTPKEFQLLELMARNPDRVLSREYLLSHVWGVTLGNTSNRLEVCIRGLRKKLSASGNELIDTEYGVGYKLMAQ